MFKCIAAKLKLTRDTRDFIYVAARDVAKFTLFAACLLALSVAPVIIIRFVF